MPHTTQEKKKAITRIRRIRGQAEALEKAVNIGTDCSILLQQITAIRGAVNSLMSEVLEGHLRETFEQENISSSSKEIRNALDDTLMLVRTYFK